MSRKVSPLRPAHRADFAHTQTSSVPLGVFDIDEQRQPGSIDLRQRLLQRANNQTVTADLPDDREVDTPDVVFYPTRFNRDLIGFPGDGKLPDKLFQRGGREHGITHIVVPGPENETRSDNGRGPPDHVVCVLQIPQQYPVRSLEADAGTG